MKKPITMTDLARAAGVSKNTISLALRNDIQIGEATRKKIHSLAQTMGYQKNPTVAHLMVKLRAARTPNYKATLALLNANQDAQAFLKHPTIPTYVRGCRRRAEQLGYSLDEFWLHDPDLNGKRLNRILTSRNIQGIIVVGLMHENRLPAGFMSTWRDFPAVVTGVRTKEPTLSFVATDHHVLASRAFEKAIELGYRRPALVLDHTIDDLTDGRFTSGVLIAQRKIPKSQQTRPFYDVSEARQNPRLFIDWFQTEQPDCILTLYHVVKTWLKSCSPHPSAHVGLIQLEWRSNHAEWAGMNQNNDIVGEASVDTVISMIHNGETGVPLFPRSTLIECSWVPGETVSCASKGKRPRAHSSITVK